MQQALHTTAAMHNKPEGFVVLCNCNKQAHTTACYTQAPKGLVCINAQHPLRDVVLHQNKTIGLGYAYATSTVTTCNYNYAHT